MQDPGSKWMVRMMLTWQMVARVMMGMMMMRRVMMGMMRMVVLVNPTNDEDDEAQEI